MKKIILLIVLLFAPSLLAQEVDPRYAVEMRLLRLRGDHVDIYYTPGSLDRAANAQRRFELLVNHINRQLKATLALKIWVLGPEDWHGRDLERRPYGFPSFTDNGILAIPAWGTTETVALWRDLWGQVLPQAEGAPIRGSHAEAAALVLSDLVAMREVATLLVNQTGITGESLWMNHLFGTLAARSFGMQYEAQQEAGTFAFYERYAEREAPCTPYQWTVVPSERESLCRGAWLNGAAQILEEEDGWKVLKQIRKLGRKGPITREQLLDRYSKLSPPPESNQPQQR